MKRVLLARAPACTFWIRRFCRPNALQLFFFALLTLNPATKAQAAQKNVLVLSGGRGRVSINLMESSLRAHFSEPVNFSIVDLEPPPVEETSYQNNLAEALRVAYANEKLDLVIAVMTQSLQFAVQYHDKIFPRVPVVFMSVSTPLPEKMWRGVTGVVSATGIPETIGLALRLHPDAQAFAVITKASGPENDWYLAEHSELLRHRDKVREIDLFGPASPELLQRVADLPPHTVVLFQLYPQDANQPAFGAFDVLAAVAQRFPTYSILPHITLGRGGIGAASYDPPTDAVMAGQLAARVLSGERPDNIPVVQNSGVRVSVDWQQLRRWNIPESALPPGTLVLYREPTLWERGRKYFLVGSALILAQALLILGLFWQRARKRRAEAELRKSEEKFSKSFRQSPLVVAITTKKDSRFIDVSESFEQQFGWNRNEVIGRTPLDCALWVDADQWTAFRKLLLDNGSVRALEVSLRSKDGQIRTALVSAEMIEVGGEPCTLSVAADITERKRAEQALSTVSSRLIETQEKERTRIARELHDDINQRLALLAINLERLKQDHPSSNGEATRVEDVQKQVQEIANDIQSLSHRLHSSKLEYLGLEAASAGLCREFSEQHNVEIDFHSEIIAKDLSKEISLCLFRVLQEALQNAVKHSGSRHFEVSLRDGTNEIELSVYDSGTGFDVGQSINGHGLGLTSMRERLKLVDGQLFIDSKQHHGTTIYARVPLHRKMKAAR